MIINRRSPKECWAAAGLANPRRADAVKPMLQNEWRPCDALDQTGHDFLRLNTKPYDKLNARASSPPVAQHSLPFSHLACLHADFAVARVFIADSSSEL